MKDLNTTFFFFGCKSITLSLLLLLFITLEGKKIEVLNEANSMETILQWEEGIKNELQSYFPIEVEYSNAFSSMLLQSNQSRTP